MVRDAALYGEDAGPRSGRAADAYRSDWENDAGDGGESLRPTRQ